MRHPLTRFTVRRMMVAVAVVALLLTGTFSILGARQAAAQNQCRNNLLQIALALHNYHSVYDTFPSATIGRPDLPPTQRLSWTVVIFLLFEQGLQLLIDQAEPWDSPKNLRPLFRFTSTDGDPPPRTVPADVTPFLCCPAHRSLPTTNQPQAADYVGIAGLGTDAAALAKGHRRAGIFGYDRATRLEDVKDGLGSTLMMAETSVSKGPWTAGGPPTVRGLDPSHQPYLGPGRQFGGTHRGGVMVAFADGSVRFLRESTDPKVFEALSTVAGGEPLPAGWDR